MGFFLTLSECCGLFIFGIKGNWELGIVMEIISVVALLGSFIFQTHDAG